MFLRKMVLTEETNYSYFAGGYHAVRVEVLIQKKQSLSFHTLEF